VEVCHLDGAKSAVAWARRNAAANEKMAAPVRWIVDDVLTFLRREIRRGRRYEGIILDPPAFGHGPGGKRWELKSNLPELLEVSYSLLADNPCFLLFSCHDPSLSAATIRQALETLSRNVRLLHILPLAVPCDARPYLRMGTTARMAF